ncbi:MAG: hypothetical protein RBS77_03250 [Candidatus Moranbacteria bacterium]|jgi:hypothetical protein|nr:hypothetical protein [Candidatus Moranbacteria bacterium]
MKISFFRKINSENIKFDEYFKYLTEFDNKIKHISSVGVQKEQFILAMEGLWNFLISIKNEKIVLEIIGDVRFEKIQQSLSKKWHEYISLIETDIAEKYLSDDANVISSALSEEDYAGVDQELSLLDRKLANLNIVMVGCGPYPETLLEIYRNNEDINAAIGIEGRYEVTKLSNKVIAKMLPFAKNIEVRTSAAEAMDYKDLDIIFLANGLIKKDVILQRIHETAKNSVRILVRNPILMGKLLYEDFYTLQSGRLFTVCKSKKASKLSEIILLRKK